MIRIATFPAVAGPNPYLRLFYEALEPHGIHVATTAELNDTFLRRHADEFDVLHIHWTHQHLWRRGGGAKQAARGLVGAWRYLRLARRLGKRVVWTVHDLEHLERAERTDWFGNVLLARMADLVICHDKPTCDLLVRRYLGKRRSIVRMPIGNYDGAFSPSRSRAEARARLGLDPTKHTLIGAGLVRAYKGYDVAIEAARILGPEYQLLIAGQVPKEFPEVRADLESRAAGLGNVRLDFRRVSDDDLADLYSAADCVLLPYRRITGSSALLTALTLARGVVTSNLPYFQGFLEENPGIGIVAEPGPDALAQAIRDYFTIDVTTRSDAARRAAERYPWSEVVRPVAEWFRAAFPAPQLAGAVP